MSSMIPSRKPSLSLLIVLLFAFLAISSIVQTANAAPSGKRSKPTKPNPKHNPFLVRNLESSGHDSNYQELKRELGVRNKRIASVLGGSMLRGDDHKNMKRQSFV
ncbi:hypothetical protein BGZ76_006240 [Entomortierella beljakovae]|nr:hypothetical protein BGZ76_006240 [Entomortierella beljakovae]